MDITNNWTIVVGVATIVSMIFLWSKQAYLDPIVKREEEIKNKVKADAIRKLKEFQLIIEEQGEEKFADEMGDIIEFRKNLRDLKDSFGGKMIPSGIGICIISAILVSIWSYNNILINFLLIYFAVILFWLIISSFIKMKRYESQISRYLEGENPTNILND